MGRWDDGVVGQGGVRLGLWLVLARVGFVARVPFQPNTEGGPDRSHSPDHSHSPGHSPDTCAAMKPVVMDGYQKQETTSGPANFSSEFHGMSAT